MTINNRRQELLIILKMYGFYDADGDPRSNVAKGFSRLLRKYPEMQKILGLVRLDGATWIENIFTSDDLFGCIQNDIYLTDTNSFDFKKTISLMENYPKLTYLKNTFPDMSESQYIKVCETAIPNKSYVGNLRLAKLLTDTLGVETVFKDLLLNSYTDTHVRNYAMRYFDQPFVMSSYTWMMSKDIADLGRGILPDEIEVEPFNQVFSLLRILQYQDDVVKHTNIKPKTSSFETEYMNVWEPSDTTKKIVVDVTHKADSYESNLPNSWNEEICVKLVSRIYNEANKIWFDDTTLTPEIEDYLEDMSSYYKQPHK